MFKIGILLILIFAEKSAAGSAADTCFQCPVVDGIIDDCIYPEWECDGIADCVSGADEHQGCRDLCDTAFCKQPTDDFAKCQPSRYVCDGSIDCEDAADEHPGCKDSCSGIWCPSVDRSDVEVCVASFKKCNGNIDCADSSDEPADCEDECDGFWCGPGDGYAGKCIPSYWKCDDFEDCLDKSDEEGCGNTKRQSKRWQLH